uniref:Uncharacterized protein n=1 Tax=Anguilla anguilla TaxID=7936 RepID=A0A0E9QJF9_ANGAN
MIQVSAEMQWRTSVPFASKEKQSSVIELGLMKCVKPMLASQQGYGKMEQHTVK